METIRCNLAFGLAALLAVAVIASINSLSLSASSAPEDAIATNDQGDRGGCEHKNGCFPI